MNGAVLLMLLFATVVLSFDANTASPQEPSEYCELEQFTPRCHDDKVILITEARYGLVSLGRCLQADFGYVGCFADVVDYIGAKCTGRRSCQQQVPDRFMKQAAAKCRQEFNGFLYAAYNCIDAGDSECTSCQSEGVIRVNADNEGGFIGSVVVDERQDEDGCGTSRCPWIISSRPGQVINLTLFEYNDRQQPQTSSDSSRSAVRHSGAVARRPASSSSSCAGRRYAVVKERSNPTDASICASEHLTDHVTRRHVFTSVSYVIELRVVARKTRDVDAHTAFLIHYQAVGCADLSPPSNIVLRRVDDKSELKCLLNGVTWTLRCVDGQWDGEMGVCEQPSFNVHSLGDTVLDRFHAFYNMSYIYISSLHPGIVLTTIGSFVVIVIVIISTCCFVCCRRRHYKRQCSQQLRQRTIPRPLTAKTAAMTPKLLPAGAPLHADDVNDYGGGCVVHRPLPSLPRRMDGSWAKSVRSDASGSDASLHWDVPEDDTTRVDSDSPSTPRVHGRAVRCRSVATGPGDYSTAEGSDDAGCPAGYRTMPRPGVGLQSTAPVGKELDQQRLLVAQQLQRQLRPIDDFDARPYANVASHSVDV